MAQTHWPDPFALNFELKSPSVQKCQLIAGSTGCCVTVGLFFDSAH